MSVNSDYQTKSIDREIKFSLPENKIFPEIEEEPQIPDETPNLADKKLTETEKDAENLSRQFVEHDKVSVGRQSLSEKRVRLSVNNQDLVPGNDSIIIHVPESQNSNLSQPVTHEKDPEDNLVILESSKVFAETESANLSPLANFERDQPIGELVLVPQISSIGESPSRLEYEKGLMPIDESVVFEGPKIIPESQSFTLSQLEKLDRESLKSFNIFDDTKDEADSAVSPDLLSDNQNGEDGFSQDFDMAKFQEGAEFALLSAESEGSLGMKSHYTTALTEDSSESSSGSSSAEKEPEIDREMYYKMYRICLEQYKKNKLLNDCFQNKMAAYYNRRKVSSLDDAVANDNKLKYDKELDIFDEKYENAERERRTLLTEIQNLTLQRNAKTNELEALFESLRKKLKDYGYGIALDTSGATMEKITDRFLRIQKSLQNSLISMRLTNIKLKNHYNETVKKIEAMDHLGPGFSIMDYVQLKNDNRLLQDRLEEKEYDLLRIRNNCRHSMQVLAHNREKSSRLDVTFKKFRDNYVDCEENLNDAREQLNFLKHERDNLREETVQLRYNNGLLTFPEMLYDMDKDLRELDSIKQQIETTKDRCRDLQYKTVNVRKHMEIFIRHKNQMKAKSQNQIQTKSDVWRSFSNLNVLNDLKNYSNI